MTLLTSTATSRCPPRQKLDQLIQTPVLGSARVEKTGHRHEARNPLSHSLIDPTRQPLRHQVFELPKVVPEKIEYRQHWLRCSCGHCTLAPLQKEVAGSSFGPRLHAAIAYLTANHRVSRRGIAEIMATLFGINISTGAVCKVNERVSEDCRPVVGAIKRYVAAAALLNIDETGWKNKGNNRAERAIRPAVQWRKLCFGSQSDSGERFVDRLLSVTATCRLHGVNPFEFLTKVVSSASAGEQPPQLLPQQYHLNS